MIGVVVKPCGTVILFTKSVPWIQINKTAVGASKEQSDMSTALDDLKIITATIQNVDVNNQYNADKLKNYCDSRNTSAIAKLVA
jgi:hypothetical protein